MNKIKVTDYIYSGATIEEVMMVFITEHPDKDKVLRVNIEWVESAWVLRATCK